MKDFKIQAQFIFSGSITIPAEDEDAAREMIETGVGLCLGGNVHTHHDDVDWEMDSHAELRLYELDTL